MAEPFIFVGTYGIREGKLEAAKQAFQDLVRHVEANEPRLQVFGMYFDADHNQATCVQVHPDEASMELHLKVIAGHLQDAGDYLDFASMRTYAYGVPGDALLSTLREWDGDALHVAAPLSGFNRLAAV